MQSPNERRHVVVIGGGAAGMVCTRELSREARANVAEVLRLYAREPPRQVQSDPT